jgi:small subunit ribosomal protein S2e
VKDGKVKTLEEIYLFSLPIKEYQIVEEILGEKLKDEVFKISPVQKQTQAGQRTKFRAIVVVGDFDGHIGLGSKVSKEVATAIRGAIQDAKCNVIPVRRGFWGIKFGAPHTVPCSVTGKTGSVRVRLVPAPRGTGLVGAKVTKKFLTMAGIKDVYSSTQGYTRTVGNFLGALFSALRETYSYLTPDMWTPTHWESSLYQKFTDHLRDSHKPKTDLSAKKSS